MLLYVFIYFRVRGFKVDFSFVSGFRIPDIDPALFCLGRQGGDDSLKTISIQQQDIKIDQLGYWVLIKGIEQ